MEAEQTAKSTASYYLSDEVQKWIKAKAAAENRSESNFLETLLRQIRDVNPDI